MASNICHQFLSISYWSNSEFWSQKRIQNGNIHSIKLDVYAESRVSQIFLFIIHPSSQQQQQQHLESFTTADYWTLIENRTS